MVIKATRARAGREGPLEQGLRSPGKGVELRRDSHRTNSVHHNHSGNKDAPPCLGAPPPLISPKGHHHAPAPPTTLWNPASLVDTPADSRRKLNPATPPKRYTSLRGASLQEAGSWNKAEQDRAIQSLYQRHHMSNLHQRACASPTVQGTCPDPVGRSQASSPRERQSQPPDSMLVYDEVLQQHRRLLSFYYDQDESYDESDEEEVKAHLRRVTKQPPLKLDASSEKVDFLRVCAHSRGEIRRGQRELLSAIQKKTVTLDTLRYNPLPPCSSPPAPSNGDSHQPPCLANQMDIITQTLPALPLPIYTNPNIPPITTHSNPLRTPTWPASLQPWPPIIKRSQILGQMDGVGPGRGSHQGFAQHFHQAVLQSTHNTLQNKEWSIERQILHSQCKRLEAQNYNLTRTAEQLSLNMGELVSQRQKVREERERLQAQLEHFRRCLTLPNIHWGRGQVNGHTQR
ncbi:hypothetical protein KUCAC02_020956 [Chaenocephalus aceratus]|uniref:Uncharacterized protein n=1 Tax=Chaenocephalus aceratus TaxID=36190 RepID=A0ACB9XG76_CHAAC|nr:hypothetical protein KUCAC02_020956 [Chaenocephalus aceratus]